MFETTALRDSGRGFACTSNDGRAHPRVRLITYSTSGSWIVASVLFGGCTLSPTGTQDEKARSEVAGAPYAAPVADRILPELPPNPTWRSVLHRAFMANGELEKSYYDWKAAVERIGIASAYPNSNLTLGYSVALGQGGMKAFDRMTFSAGFDSMENLSLPVKVKQAGKIALDEARAAGERFAVMKFDLQRRVLSSWADFSLLAEKRRIESDELLLARAVMESTRARLAAGGAQQDLLKAEIVVRRAEDRVRSLDAEIAGRRALLNGMLGRNASDELPSPVQLPDPRVLAADDATLIAAAVDANPELLSLAHEVEGRKDALELARLAWLPDINPAIALTGGVTQAIGAAIVLPTTIAEIDGRIHEAESMLNAAEAAIRQARSDRAASFVATLVALRDNERQARLFESLIAPAAQRVLDTVRQSYVAGRSTLLDLLDAQRTLLDVKTTVAEARTSREIRLAELEALAGIDIETLSSTESVLQPNHENNAADASADGAGKQ